MDDRFNPHTTTPLKEILIRERRSQAWLAREVGIARSRINQFANGVLTPGEGNRRKIAEVLGRSEAEIWPAQGVRCLQGIREAA